MTTVSGFLYKFEMENVKLLQAKGYEVHYAANEAMPCYLVDEAVKQTSGVVFHPVGIEKPSIKFRQHMHVLHEIVDIIRQEQITVVHCHTPMGGVLGRLAGKQCKKYGIELCVIPCMDFIFIMGHLRLNRGFINLQKHILHTTRTS